MRKISILLVMIFSFGYQAKAQEIENLVKAADDANKIAHVYVTPAVESLIYSMNSGWFHTAKVHKKFGFDLSIGLSGAFIPPSKETYKISELGLDSKIKSSPATSPTIFGDDTKGKVVLETKIKGKTPQGIPVAANVEIPIDLPTGFKKDLPGGLVPAPAIQLTVGLPWKFETSLRYVPKVGSENVKGSLFGIGIKKELTQYLGVIDKLPFHLSLMATYTSMDVDAPINIKNTANFIIKDGITQFRLNGYTVQALASLNFPIINFYGAIGYGGGSANLDVLGDYTVTYEEKATNQKIQKNFKNPIKQQYSVGGIKATIGTRLSLGFFKIFADYTLQEYNTVSAGIALSFR